MLGGLFPVAAVAIDRAARASDIEGLRRLDQALTPLWNLFKTHSSLRVIYAAANALGLCSHVPPLPILPLDRTIQAEVAEVIRRLQPVLESG